MGVRGVSESPLNSVGGKMLLRWICCSVEDVEDVATLKALLRWRCWGWYYHQLQNSLLELKMKKMDAHFTRGSLENYAVLTRSTKTLKFYQHAITLVSTKSTLTDKHNRDETILFSRTTYPRYVVLKRNNNTRSHAVKDYISTS